MSNSTAASRALARAASAASGEARAGGWGPGAAEVAEAGGGGRGGGQGAGRAGPRPGAHRAQWRPTRGRSARSHGPSALRSSALSASAPCPSPFPLPVTPYASYCYCPVVGEVLAAPESALCGWICVIPLSLSAAGQGLPIISSIYANVANAVSLTICCCLLPFFGFWYCMRFDLLLGSARGMSWQHLHQPCVAGKGVILSLSMPGFYPLWESASQSCTKPSGSETQQLFSVIGSFIWLEKASTSKSR